MRIVLASVFLVFQVHVVGVCAGLAQTSPPVSTKLLIPIVVSRKTQTQIDNFTDSDLEIFDGKNRLSVISLRSGKVPFTTGIIFDLSESVKKKGNDVLGRLSELIEGGRKESEYFLIAIQADRFIASEPTSDRQKLASALRELKEYQPKGNTPLYDAINAAVEKLTDGPNTNKLLLIISDGVDNSSRSVAYDELRKIVRGKDILVYALNIKPSSERTTANGMKGEAFLQQLAEVSGGKMFYLDDNSTKGKWPQMLIDELENLYFAEVGIEITTSKPKWHKLNVQLTQTGRKKFGSMNIRSKKEYFF